MISSMNDNARQLDILTEQHYDEIYKYCRRRVDTDDAAFDITQNVFLAFSERYFTIDATKIRKWLYETAKHKVADHYRELQKKKDLITDTPIQNLDAEQHNLSYDPFNHMDEEEIEEIAKSIVKNLEPVDKELFLDRFVKGKGYPKLAEKYNTSEQNIRKRVSRLHKKIKTIVHGFLEMLIIMLLI